MNHFELFKLKKAGLTNLNILAILEYHEKQKKSLSLREWLLSQSAAILSCLLRITSR